MGQYTGTQKDVAQVVRQWIDDARRGNHRILRLECGTGALAGQDAMDTPALAAMLGTLGTHGQFATGRFSLCGGQLSVKDATVVVAPPGCGAGKLALGSCSMRVGIGDIRAVELYKGNMALCFHGGGALRLKWATPPKAERR